LAVKVVVAEDGDVERAGRQLAVDGEDDAESFSQCDL
jgi:hypothetical protein